MRRFVAFAFSVLLALGGFFLSEERSKAQDLSPRERAELEAQYNQLLKEIEAQQQIIKETQAQKNTLQGDVTLLNAKIKAAQAQIDAKNITIKQLAAQIVQKNETIG